VAEDVHVEAHRLLDHALTDPAGANDGQRAAGDLVPQPGQVGVPGRPLVGAHLHLGGVEPARDAPSMKKAYSAVASVRTSGVWVNGMR